MDDSPRVIKKYEAGWIEPPPAQPEAKGIREIIDDRGYLESLIVVDPDSDMNSSRSLIRKAIKEKYADRVPDMLLDDMRIQYDQYESTVTFSSRIPWTPQLGLGL